MKEGTWPQECVQRAFVEGAKWWQFHHGGSTMFSSERAEAESEAIIRYGEPAKREIVKDVEKCDHNIRNVGIWTDKLYRCHPLLECSKCHEKIYVGR